MSRDYAAKLASLRAELEELKSAKSQILRTGQSWRIRNGEDNREYTAASLVEINHEIQEIERQIAILEDIVEGNSHCPNGVRIRARVL